MTFFFFSLDYEVTSGVENSVICFYIKLTPKQQKGIILTFPWGGPTPIIISHKEVEPYQSFEGRQIHKGQVFLCLYNQELGSSWGRMRRNRTGQVISPHSECMKNGR